MPQDVASRRFGSRTGTVLGALSVASGVALTATAAWLITRASEHPPVLELMVAIIGVRTFGLARPILRYAERMVSHDAALRLLAERRAEVYDALVPLVPGRLGPRRGDVLTSVVDDVDSVLDRRLRVDQPVWTAVLVCAGATVVAALATPTAGLGGPPRLPGRLPGGPGRLPRGGLGRERLRAAPGRGVDAGRGDPAQRQGPRPLACRRACAREPRRRRGGARLGGPPLGPRGRRRPGSPTARRRSRHGGHGDVPPARSRLRCRAGAARHAPDRPHRGGGPAPGRGCARGPHGRGQAATGGAVRRGARGDRPGRPAARRPAPPRGPQPRGHRGLGRRGRASRDCRSPWTRAPGSAWWAPRAPASRRTPR